jgi:hypothetical protein
LPAEHGGRKAAAIEEHEGLLAARNPRADAGAESTTQDDVRPFGRVLLAHVDDRHGGERPIEHAAREYDPFVLAGDRVVVALHRRRRRPEDDQRAGLASADDGDVAAVVSRTLFLLVGAVVLFVNDNQSHLLERREHRRPGADDDIDVAAADALPLVVALAIGEAAVLDGDAVAERLAEDDGHRGSEGDLRHQDQHAAAAAADRGREAQVDFRLAAARHTVEEGDSEVAGGVQRAKAVEGRGLLRRQLSGVHGAGIGAGIGAGHPKGIPVDSVVSKADVATLREA